MNRIRKSIIQMVCLGMLIIAGKCLSAQTLSTPEKQILAPGRESFDDNWLFHKGDETRAETPGFDDRLWRLLDLPHDWSIEDLPDQHPDSIVGPFSRNSVGGPFTGNTVGGIAWYRKHFSADPRLKQGAVYLLFEGVYQHAEVWINGHQLGNHPNGYTPFYFDISPWLAGAGQANTIAVRVSNLGHNSRWYSGSGIYRHVWLIHAAATHIPPMGIHISNPVATANEARILVYSAIQAGGMMGVMKIKTTLISPDGKIAAKSEDTLRVDSHTTGILQSFTILHPANWSIENPELYKAVITLTTGGRMLDSQTIAFGIRSITMDAKNGLLLNGKRVILKGGCLHHDYGPLGAAAIDRAEERRLEMLKANGFNAIRTSHNPPSPHFLDLCDRLGFLVIDEAFDEWEEKKLFDDSSAYHHFFKDWWRKDLDAMVLRDRNHPSVFLWSIGNEIHERADTNGLRITRELIDEIHTMDSSRKITEGMCWFWDHNGRPWDSLQPAMVMLDVPGYNYEWPRYGDEHTKYPDRVIVGTEAYPLDAFHNYDFAEKNPYVLGDFVWTAWDYIGEAGIGHALMLPDSLKNDQTMLQPWPWFNANCGDIDMIGNKKAQSYYHDVVWRQRQIALLVKTPAPEGMKNIPNGWGWPIETRNWTWPGREGKPLTISIYSRCERVRLELNGRILTELTLSAATQWMAHATIAYQPGILKAIGFREGKPVDSSLLQTAGNPARIELSPDRHSIRADGKDLCYVMVEITDTEGNWIPAAALPLQFNIDGAGSLAAVGNANPHEAQSFRQSHCRSFEGRCLLILRAGKKKGIISVHATSPGLKPFDLKVKVD